MDRNKQMIKEYLQKLDPKKLGLNKTESIRVKKIGLGESNLNYLAIVNEKKFTVRINMDSRSPSKSKKEYDSLRVVEHLGIAPKVFHLESSREYLGEPFIIIEYLEGKSLEELRKIGENTLKELGRIVAQLHSTSIEDIERGLEKIGSSKTDILNEIRGRIDYIKTKRKSYFKEKGEFENILRTLTLDSLPEPASFNRQFSAFFLFRFDRE